MLCIIATNQSLNMKSLRLRLSHLKNKISETLPNENDIFGYKGINKDIILTSLSESYDLLSTLADFPDKFETVFAKREVASSIDKIQDYFNTYFSTENSMSKFNDLLKSVARIRYILTETYISISDKPLRVDYELAKAKENLEELTSKLTEIEEHKTKIETIKDNSTTFITELEEKHKTAIENEKRISEYVESINEIKENLIEISKNIISWKADIEAKQTDIIKIKTETDQISEKSIENIEIINKQISTLSEQIETNSKHQDHIQKTIEDVSRYGMAGSFKKRKDELKWAQLTWAILTILSLGGLLVISYFIMKPLLDGTTININHLFYKIPILASGVWLGWFCSKQYGFNTRIREDYAYKYAISMAFEGYKNEAKEINKELLEKLLELTILNAARSPERIYNTRNNPGSPYNEMIDTIACHLFGGKKENEKE